MGQYRGLTWDHPRGHSALAAAAARVREGRDGPAIVWDKQPLEGFESHPIEDLCDRYDIVVLDHPHVGEAIARNCLQPLEALFRPEELAAWRQDTVGPCLTSYRYAGLRWALPLDAATQVMALRADLLDRSPPETWAEIVDLPPAVPVCLSIAGPHAILTLMSIAVALGEPPASVDPGRFLSDETLRTALDIMRCLDERAPAATRQLNPIGILRLMAGSSALALCPLIYGYVNYAVPTDRSAPVAFHDAPAASRGGRPGSTLGGTGVAVARRCAVTPALLDHLRWLMSEEAQVGFIPEHEGQPSRCTAWTDAGINGRWGGFYRQTLRTLEASWVRPRFDGYIRFQTEASAIVRQGLEERLAAKLIAARLQDRYSASRSVGAEL
jgi:multiple sugar transport system substrate-binding protein